MNEQIIDLRDQVGLNDIVLKGINSNEKHRSEKTKRQFLLRIIASSITLLIIVTLVFVLLR